MILSTGIDSSAERAIISFPVQLTPTVKKPKPATEAHDSQQSCTVRPTKGAGQSPRGREGGVFKRLASFTNETKALKNKLLSGAGFACLLAQFCKKNHATRFSMLFFDSNVLNCRRRNRTHDVPPGR
jgi:hypothetical protein